MLVMIATILITGCVKERLTEEGFEMWSIQAPKLEKPSLESITSCANAYQDYTNEDFEVENGFFSIIGEEGKTEALSAAIWIWGVVGIVLLLILVIAGVRQYKRKKKRQ